MFYFEIDNAIDENKKDRYIALIKNFKKDGGRKVSNQFVSITKTKTHKSVPSIILQHNQQFIFLPQLDDKRSVIYASGASGSGKTYLANDYAEIYHLLYPERHIFFFTCNTMHDDKSLTQGLYTEIDLEKFIPQVKNKEVEAELFRDSLIIIDDIANGLTPEEDKILWKWIDTTLECFRRKNTSVYIINHLSTDYKKTRLIILEAQKYIIYCNNLKARSDRVLSTYYKLDTKTINSILDANSRWVCVDSINSLIMTETELYNIQHKKIK